MVDFVRSDAGGFLTGSMIGMLVKADAELELENGRFYVFRVTAHNGSTEIGRGTVTRAIVNPGKVAERHAKGNA